MLEVRSERCVQANSALVGILSRSFSQIPNSCSEQMNDTSTAPALPEKRADDKIALEPYSPSYNN